MVSAFQFLTNTTMEFDVPTGLDTTDRSGNPVPETERVLVKAYLKPLSSNKAPKEIRDQHPLDVSAQYLEGYLTSHSVFPRGIEAGSKAKAVYQGSFLGSQKRQVGTVIIYFGLQSSVGADSITGQKIFCVFVVSGGGALG